MQFTLRHEEFGPYTIIVVESSNGVSFGVIPEMGARLNSFVVPLKDGTLNIIDGYTSVEQLTVEYYAKSSLLAPFPNRIADGAYEFEGNKYKLPINKLEENNAIHGFISNKPFSLKRSGLVENSYELEFGYDSSPTEGYPFAFTIKVVYKLSNSGALKIRTEIINTSDKKMPVGIGWHPYFTTGERIEDVELRLPPVKQLEVDTRLIPTGRMFEMIEWSESKRLEKAEFDTGFQFTTEDKTICLRDFSKNFEIKITCLTGYDYVQIFTPPWRTAIAIEPMTCATDAYNNKLGLKTLKSDEKLLSEFEIITVES